MNRWIRRYGMLASAALTGVAIVGGPAGCASSTTNDDASATPTVSTRVPVQRGTAEERALDAYRGMWRAYASAALTADPHDQALATYATDAALNTLTSGLADLRRKGEVIKGEYLSGPRIASASPVDEPTAVVIEDCLDDSRFLTYKATGEPAGGEAGGRRATRATVKRDDAGHWKVSGFGVQGVGTC